MDENQCFICKDNRVILYKICDCVDSTICEECYGNEETSKMDKCGICRKDYEFNYNRNYLSFFNILIEFLTKYSIILCIEMFPPIYIYLIEDYSIENNILLSIAFFFITIGNIIIYNFIRLYIGIGERYNNMKLLIPIKLIYIISMFCVILVMYKNNKIIIYNYFVVLFIYILPLFLISVIILIDSLTHFKKYINDKTLTRTIKIKSIFQSTHTSSQSSINYV